MPLGMITRHFDHPSGATATLEMPAGWSRNCWYVLTIIPSEKDLGLHQAASIVTPDRQTFSTPEAARAGAIAREREALSNGWRPRIAKQVAKPRGDECRLYWTTGEPLNVGIQRCAERLEGAFVVQQRLFDIDGVVLPGHSIPELRAGQKLLLRQAFHGAERLAGVMVRSIEAEMRHDALPRITIEAGAVELTADEQTAIERWSSVASIIGDLADDPDQSLKRLWEQIAARMPDADSSKRAQVQQQVLSERAARQAAEVRAIEEQRSRERAEAEQAVQRTMPRPAAARSRTTAISPDREALEAQMRRLAGGQDLGKPKRRQINLE